MDSTPTATAPKLDFRLSYGTSDAEKKEISQVTSFIQGWQIQAAYPDAPEVQTLCTHLSSLPG